MNGLLQQQPAAQPQQPEQPQQPQQGGGADEIYQRIIENVKSFLYSEQGVKAAKQAFSKGSAANAIAVMAGRMIQQMMNQMKQAGKDIPEKLIMQATIEIIAMIAEMGYEGGFIEQGTEDEVTRQAAEIVMEQLGKDNRDLPAAKRQQFAQIVQGVFGGQA